MARSTQSFELERILSEDEQYQFRRSLFDSERFKSIYTSLEDKYGIGPNSTLKGGLIQDTNLPLIFFFTGIGNSTPPKFYRSQADFLLAKGANLNIQIPLSFDIFSLRRASPLMVASVEGCYDSIPWLLTKGADFTLVTDGSEFISRFDSKTAFSLAKDAFDLENTVYRRYLKPQIGLTLLAFLDSPRWTLTDNDMLSEDELPALRQSVLTFLRSCLDEIRQNPSPRRYPEQILNIPKLIHELETVLNISRPSKENIQRRVRRNRFNRVNPLLTALPLGMETPFGETLRNYLGHGPGPVKFKVTPSEPGLKYIQTDLFQTRKRKQRKRKNTNFTRKY